jgi:hypothetical protein
MLSIHCQVLATCSATEAKPEHVALRSSKFDTSPHELNFFEQN